MATKSSNVSEMKIKELEDLVAELRRHINSLQAKVDVANEKAADAFIKHDAAEARCSILTGRLDELQIAARSFIAVHYPDFRGKGIDPLATPPVECRIIQRLLHIAEGG